MNFCPPAMPSTTNINPGIMQQLGLPEMAIDIRHLLDGSLQAMVTCGYFRPASVLNARRSEAVGRASTGMQMVQSVLKRIRGGEMKVGFLPKFPLSSEKPSFSINYRVY